MIWSGIKCLVFLLLLILGGDVSYILYVFPVVLGFYSVFFSKDTAAKYIVVSGFMFLLLALRDGVGYDYYQYQSFYYAEYYSPEPISKLMLWVALPFGSHYWYFSMYALIGIGFVFVSAWSERKYTILLSYLCLPWFFLESFSILRQGAAIAVCVYCYSLYLRGDKRFFVFSILAVCMHFSSAIFLSVLSCCWFMPKKFQKYLFFLGGVLFVFLDQFLSAMAEFYPRLEYYDGGADFGFGLLAVTVVFYLAVLVQKSDTIHYYIIGLGILLNYTAMGVDSVFIRLAYYFYIPFCFVEWKRWGVGSKLFQFMMFFSVYVAFISIRSGDFDGSLIPYSTYLE